jgi:hypothetical protein
MIELIAALLQGAVLIAKYLLDGDRREALKEKLKDDDLANVGQSIRERRLRLIGFMLDRELRGQKDRNTPRRSLTCHEETPKGEIKEISPEACHDRWAFSQGQVYRLYERLKAIDETLVDPD